LRLFREEDIREQTIAMLHDRGPNEALGYLVSWREPLFHDTKGELVRAALPYLHSHEDWQLAGTLRMLILSSTQERSDGPRIRKFPNRQTAPY
jgi:hypothetical protein